LRFRFYTTNEGGRRTPVGGPEVGFYSCPLIYDDQAFDCRILLSGDALQLGETYERPIVFLSRAEALRWFPLGRELTLWEGRPVGQGELIEKPSAEVGRAAAQ
jgi:hypothetical protein